MPSMFVTPAALEEVLEEVAHVGDARDVEVIDGAVLIFGGARVGVPVRERRPQLGLGRKDVCC
eukprot:scaffold14015_cov48-Phaeocystis_antarctica.AAC.3